jgi:hypothetical protein
VKINHALERKVVTGLQQLPVDIDNRMDIFNLMRMEIVKDIGITKNNKN